MRQGWGVDDYRERQTAPLAWWLGALFFGVVCGWLMLVATTWPVAIITTIVTALLAGAGLWRYGSRLVRVDHGELHVGRARLTAAYLGEVEPLDRSAYRHRLGPGADVRAWLATRPYLDRGVIVRVDDDADPTPYWLVGTRHPELLARALGHHPGPAVTPDNVERTTDGEEA